MALEAQSARTGFGRRDFLRLGGLGGLALGVAACGSSSSAGSSPAASGTPRRGGTLQAALSGGGSEDTLNAINPGGSVDFARILQLNESLVQFDQNAVPQLWLAEEVTPNSAADQWTIKLRSGITFHNGKPLTADDVIYSFQQIVDPANVAGGAPAFATVDVKGIKKLDNLTISVPCTSPYSTFLETLACYYYQIVPVGYNKNQPIGTGPFKYQSFTPGQQSVFVRNENYWQTGLPYLDKLVISDYANESSQINALISGEADVIDLLSAESISPVKSGGGTVLIADAGGFNPIFFRVDVAPFSDVRVRQALRLVVNRPQMLEVVFGGYGTIGNDVFAIWDSDYDHGLPQRQQDLDQAKFLLKQAGQENLSFQLVTAPLAQGVTNTAETFAEQAQGAGINVRLRQITYTEMYGPNFLKWPAAQDLFYYQPYYFQVALSTLGTAPFNDTHFNNPQYNKLYLEGLATIDAAKRKQIAYEMQEIDYNQGGNVIPYFPPVIDGLSAKVHGITASKTGLPLGTFDFKHAWLD